jgi:hypothetical protein
MTTRFLTVGFIVAVVASGAARQTPRDSAVQASGTASLGGTVLTDDATPQPLRRAVVTLNGLGVTVGRTAITDDLGRFVFSSLPAGRFSLMVTKAAYITTYYRNRRPGRSPAVPIPLETGQQLTGVTLRMPRGAVITGVVRDRDGRAPPMASVQASLVQTIGGERTVNRQLSGSGYVDERGVYRVYGLVPGDYVVSVSVMPMFSSDVVRLTTADDIVRAEITVREASAATAPKSATPPTVDEPPLGYATVWYPGTADFANSAVVTVGPGEERGGIDFPLPMVPMATVSGAVLGPAGLVDAATVNLVSQGPTGASSTGVGIDAKTGTFSFSGVAPGAYTLVARARDARSSNPLPLSATSELIVDGHNVTGLTLALQPGVSVSGHVLRDVAATGSLDFTTVRLSLESAFPGGGSTFFVQPVQADAAGVFLFTGITPGKYRLTASVAASRDVKWTMTSAMVAGHDMSELAAEIRPGESITDAWVTVTDRSTELSGLVLDGTGAPATDYAIVVFAADKQYWTRNSRRIKGPIRPGADGRYVVSDLPAGTYFLAALTDVDPAELNDASLLEQLAAAAIPLTLVEGERRVQDIRIGGSSHINVSGQDARPDPRCLK